MKQVSLEKTSTVFEHPTARIVDVRIHLASDDKGTKPWIAATFAFGSWSGDVFTALPGPRSEQKAIEDLPQALQDEIESLIDSIVEKWSDYALVKGTAEAEPK